jgi:ATPase family associated with various cellular activities (AAA)
MVCGDLNTAQALKSDVIGQWIDSEWKPRYPGADLLTLWVSNACIEDDVIAKFDREKILPGGFRFIDWTPTECAAVTPIHSHDWEGDLTHRTGAFIYRFATPETGETIETVVVSSHYNDQGWYMITLAGLPRAFLPTWVAFERECDRLSGAIEPGPQVIIIGGRSNSFVPTVNWDDVVLPEKLKADILEDANSFFAKGIDVYRRLNLKPFRKLLLAGVPGTGKTMICSALAKWALGQGYVVIYISSSYRNPGEPYGSTFGKIQHALSVAAYSQYPALILLEELDAYLHPEEKAMVLNVLDGSESSINDKGTLLIATTNYPEAIDERILKRPGRLDRIFIIPETRIQDDAEKMLRQYLGVMWRDEHQALVPKLVGYPGAFIREVAVYALTQLAYDDLTDLPYELLERSFTNLKEQIDARDDFLTHRMAAQANGASNGKHEPAI